ncbi:MAG TPA: GAF domain-containing protein [Myxococcaceae bacterium]|nr:GAF domain-containing protein [Myxococcaceae bacterium]
MARFEVFIPAGEPGSFDVTLRVDAANWMQALKTGFHRLGEQGLVPHNVLVDVQDDGSVHVTDANSARVFRIREMTDAEIAASKVKPRPTPIGTPVAPDPSGFAPAPSPAMVDLVSKTPSPDAPLVGIAREVKDPHQTSGMDVPPGGMDPTVMRAPDRPTAPTAPRPTPMSTPRVILPRTDELVSTAKPPVGPIGRRKPARTPAAQMEDVLAEVFERVQGVYQRRDAADGLGYLLDLAMEKIQVEAGSVFSSELVSGDLRFVVVRGPKAQEILDAKIVIPAGTGIVGFCAVEGVSLGLSDVQKDPRYYRGVSDRVHYETRSILCSPVIAHGRTFGCMELVNRRESPVFSEYEVGMLSYIAHQGALFLDTLG